jgi:hypothetical protein
VRGYLIYENRHYTFVKHISEADSAEPMLKDEQRSLSKYLEDTSVTEKPKTIEYETHNKKENFVVGIISYDKDGNEVFKVRPPRKMSQLKREKGLPTQEGSVCLWGRSVENLRYMLKRLKVKVSPKLTNRKELCKLLRERLFYLEKHAGKKGIPNLKYMITPKRYSKK